MFQHTAARRRLLFRLCQRLPISVSTHSRPKAAAEAHLPTLTGTPFQHTAARRRLIVQRIKDAVDSGFNTQPPEGGCSSTDSAPRIPTVSTHSRPKAAV